VAGFGERNRNTLPATVSRVFCFEVVAAKTKPRLMEKGGVVITVKRYSNIATKVITRE